jgi:hypothetical protein
MDDDAYESITLRSADDTVRCRLILTNDEKLVVRKQRKNERGEWTDLQPTEGQFFIVSLRSGSQRMPS